MLHTRLSSLLATVEANLCSPASSDMRNMYSGALTWLLRWVRPGEQCYTGFISTSHVHIITQVTYKLIESILTRGA